MEWNEHSYITYIGRDQYEIYEFSISNVIVFII